MRDPPPQDLTAQLVGDGSESETSVVEPFSEWESSFCATSGCTAGAIKQGKATVSASCKEDLEKGNTIPAVVLTILDNYKLVRALTCSAAGPKDEGDYCLRRIMADLEVKSQ